MASARLDNDGVGDIRGGTSKSDFRKRVKLRVMFSRFCYYSRMNNLVASEFLSWVGHVCHQ